MAKKTPEDLDCVEMKREAQRKLRAEYEARKEEFSSYWEFLHSTAEESEWCAAMRKRFSKAKSRA